MTSGILLPDYLVKAKEAESETVEKQEQDGKDAAIARQLPAPCGYKMLIGFPKIEAKYESGILKADSVVKADEVATVIGFVIKQGPDCYKDPEKFPNGPYCKEGDFILLRAYAGTRFKIHDIEFRLVNDDSVEAVVQDPRGFSRA